MTEERSTFCALPWIHLATHPDGHISPCCESSTGKGYSSEKNLYKDSVADTLNSKLFKEIRLQMLNGVRPSACMNCFAKEDHGVQSKRLYENDRWRLLPKEAAAITERDGSIQPNLRFAELRLGNLCNLKCRSCAPHSSSKWKEDYKQLQKELEFLSSSEIGESYSWAERDGFWAEFLELSQNLEVLYINGGEPLLNSHHWAFLEQLIDTGIAPKVTLEYSTNMSVFPKRSIAVWPKFKAVIVRASIDDIGLRNRYIRHPTEWSRVRETIDQMRAINTSILVLQTVSMMNFFYLPELYQWSEKEGLPLAHNYVRDGEHLRPDSVPLEIRLELLSQFQGRLPPHLLDPLEKMWSHSGPEGAWAKSVRFLRGLDALRGENFSETFSEFAKALAQRGYEVP